MKRILAKLALVFATLGILAGCGQKVEVPSAMVGKVLTKDGYKPGVISPSKFRLDFCMAYCDEIVILNVSDQARQEPMRLFMPKDKLNMDFILQATLSVKESSYDDLYARISPDVNESGVRYIAVDKVYKTYAQQIILAEAREFLSQYTINEIASNLEQVNGALTKKLTDSINKLTPFQVRYVGISSLKYPDIIVTAQENAAQRNEMIRQEQAQLELSKVQLERELQEQRMQRAIDVEKAEAEAQVNGILSASMTEKYVQYRQLNALEKMAESDNKVFIPSRMLDSVASQMLITK